MQVWVVPEVREGKIYWRADSDSALTKACALCRAFVCAVAWLLYHSSPPVGVWQHGQYGQHSASS